MAGLLDGKVALITGGSTGIGRATAQIFAREGAQVGVADVNAEGAEETVRLIQAAGGAGLFIRADVSQAADTEAMVRTVVETYGRLDCAFNNAGIEGEMQSTQDYSEAAWERVMAINLKGVWLSMKAEIQHMLGHGGGAIVNTASAAGLVAVPVNAKLHPRELAYILEHSSARLCFASPDLVLRADRPPVEPAGE